MAKKNEGKRFEEDFQKSFDDEIYYFQRIKDSGSSFSGGTNSRFTLKNDYDCYCFLYPNQYCFELKSTKASSISIQSEDDVIKKNNSKMIKRHQINGLTKCIRYNGMFAGFVLNFRNTNNTYFLDINEFNKFENESFKKSINENDVINYNGILIDFKLKRIRYTYNIDKMINNIQERGN